MSGPQNTNRNGHKQPPQFEEAVIIYNKCHEYGQIQEMSKKKK